MISFFLTRNVAVSILIVSLGTFSIPTQASEQSQGLISEGIQLLQQGDHRAALGKFAAAEKSDRTDADAPFFSGVTSNRVGDFESAVLNLRLAHARGSKNKDLGFELGWAYLGVDSWQHALNILNRYEKAYPGRGKTSEFRGRALIQLGEFELAEEALNEAIRRDPRLEPTARAYLISLALLQGKDNLAMTNLQRLDQKSPEFRAKLGLPEPPISPLSETKPWRVNMSFSIGENDNAIALGNSVPLPADVSHESDQYARLTLDASYDLELNERDNLTFGYALLVDEYDEVSTADTVEHYFWLDFRHQFQPNIFGSVAFSDDYTRLDGDGFSNAVTVRPALSWSHHEWASLEVAYAYTHHNYFTSAAAVQDRDGTEETVSITDYFTPPGTKLRVRAGIYRTWNNRDGEDFDYDSNGLTLAVSHPLNYGITGELAFSRNIDDYDNANSLAGGGFAFSREDQINSLILRFSKPISRTMTVFGQFEDTDNDSNIAFYDYDQRIISIGVTARF